MKGVVAHLKGKGFQIVEYDDRSFIVEFQNIEPLQFHDSFTTKQTLFDYIGGTQLSWPNKNGFEPYKSNMYVTLSPPNALTLPSIIFSF